MNRTLQILPDQPAPQGEDVAQLQARLRELGLLPSHPEVQAELAAQTYGIFTVDAVREFQTDRGLKVDGVVGPQTWRALDNREHTQPYVRAPDYAACNRLEAEVLLVAQREFDRGVREVPWGSNRGPDVDRYLQWCDPPRPRDNHPGDQRFLVDPKDPTKGCRWCGLFGAACVAWACQRLQLPDPDCRRCDGTGAIPPGGSVSCSSCRGFNPIKAWGSGADVDVWAARARKLGLVTQVLSPGQVALLGVPEDLRHLVLVSWVNYDSGSLGTLEGNCDNGVRARMRRIDEVVVSLRLPFPVNWRTP